MEVVTQEPKNPLGLSLDFLFGRGYLWAERQRLNDWVALESLRMEIPDLQFPFDARGGLQRFRHTRCLVRDVEVAISEVGLGDLLTEAASEIEGFEQLQIRFLEDAVHVGVRLTRFGVDTHLSFRAALIPPEPARADEVHLSLYDYRAYGPVPYPIRLIVHELLTSLLNTPTFRSPGRGRSFTVGIAGDIVSFRPLKLLFLHIFPRVGWKLPNLSGVVLESARIRPGVMTLRAVHDDPQAAGPTHKADFELAMSREGAQALAAYEAKELFSHADRALFDGEIRQALSLLSNYRDIYGLHPALVERLLDCLVAEGSPGNLAEAEAIRRELLEEDPTDLQAALVAPNLALARRREQDALSAFESLAERLQQTQQTRDWILCELALARLLEESDPSAAAVRLREVLKRDPRHQAALEALRGLYRRLEEPARLEEILKRLTGVYTDRDTLKETYLQLARHLMDRQGDLAEARMYLEKVLRLDPTELEALYALGESYVLGGEPLRALKAFGSAARYAEVQERWQLAGELYLRVGELWYEELEDPRQALLGFRRALELDTTEDDPRAAANRRRRAAQMCEELGRDDEAAGYWREVLVYLEKSAGRGEDLAQVNSERARAHEMLAKIYERRERPAAAASHLRSLLELRPDDGDALRWMEDYLIRAGRPEELIELYEELATVAAARDKTDREREVVTSLADLYGRLGMIDEAQRSYRRALDLEPGDEQVRRELVELLTEHRRFEELRDALNSVLLRTHDRGIQYDIVVDLGGVAEAMGDRSRAARSYVEALALKAGDRRALEGACRVLDGYVADHGVHAAAPVGSQTAGHLLQRLKEQLAGVVPSVVHQRELLLQVAMIADERGDTAAGAQAREQAAALADATGDDSGFEDVDARLDAMLEQFERLAWEDGEVEERGEHQRGEPDDEQLRSFRERFQSMLKKPADLPAVEPEATPFAKAPETVQIPVAGMGALLSKDASERESEDPRRSVPPRKVVKVEDQSKPGGTFQLPRPPSLQEPSDSITSAEVHPIEVGLETLQDLRQQGEPRKIVEAIEHVLSLAESTESEILDLDQEVALAKEAGELLYYDLEDEDHSLPFLERVHRLDPHGVGASPEVVNALEDLYERRGDAGARVALLTKRLAAADTDQMRTTYRLLLAQVHYDQLDDVEGARRWLDEVLEQDAEHEAAHRLLAEIAGEQEDWAGAARHLKVVIQNAGGGLDEVEARRELAQLLLYRLNDPDAAMARFQEVLEQAPGDSQALEGIKECQALLEDWTGYVGSLTRELQMLTGRWSPGDDEPGLEDLLAVEPDQIAAALRVPASQIIADAAFIAQDELRQDETARQLWGISYQLWPEQAEVLQRRVDLDRITEAHEDLANDLEALAALKLDPVERFEALLEAARIWSQILDDPESARPLYTEALALAQQSDEPPAQLDRARRELERLNVRDH